MRKHGRTASGSQRWRCTACNLTTTAPRAVPPARTEQATLGEFIAWATSKGTQADQPGGARAFRRRTAQGRALLGLSRKLLTITTTDRAAQWPAALNDYTTEYRSWLNQRTTAEQDWPPSPERVAHGGTPTPAPAAPTSAWSVRPSRERCSPT